jgi:gamma-glutamyltranspeptidase/glutathione hydrolase
LLLSSYRGKAPLSELARHGVAAAEEAGAKARARFLRQIGAAGVLALRAPDVQQALLAVGGRMAGGTLTATDLEEATPDEAETEATLLGESVTVHAPPFATTNGDAEGIVACDARGVIAALAYAPSRDGIQVPDLEVTLGRLAVPVRRGVTRIAPGAPLPAPAPIAIARQTGGGFSLAVALAGLPRVEPGDLGWIARSTPMDAALAELRARTGARAAVAVLTDGTLAKTALVAGG